MKIKNLTKQEAIRLHRKMWNWIADETLRRKEKVWKSDYFREMNVDEDCIPLFTCYCCEYGDQKSKFRRLVNRFVSKCTYCPLDWKYEADTLMCTFNLNPVMENEGGLFKKWDFETDYKKAAELAREIANLEERK